MQRLGDFLLDPKRFAGVTSPLADALVDDDMLAEADLQRVHFEVASGALWVLLDLKGAYQYPESNTAVFVTAGTSEVSWKETPGRACWSAFMIGASRVRIRDGLVHLLLGATNGEELTAVAREVEFWTGNVPGADEAPPAYWEETDATIRAALTDWDSLFMPTSVSKRTVLRCCP